MGKDFPSKFGPPTPIVLIGWILLSLSFYHKEDQNGFLVDSFYRTGAGCAGRAIPGGGRIPGSEGSPV